MHDVGLLPAGQRGFTFRLRHVARGFQLLVAVDVARAVLPHFGEFDAHQHVGTRELLQQRVFARDGGGALHADAVRFFERDEEQADFAVLRDVAYGHVHAVAVVVGEDQGPAVDHLDQPDVAALVGDGGAAVVVHRGEEEHVLRFDESFGFVVEFGDAGDLLDAVCQFAGAEGVLQFAVLGSE